ncbi:hypothetical protein CWN45_18290 [Klebsiella pneumoniae]|uniref:hypothetical protein n=2 Tax=Klebsiella pneumoniae TaxID=573 RepID=UPI000C7ED3F7|nr:hypothetical protein [Klebsiella pneumoniae]PLO33972.1 hypothetical protein CWN45_18290 [Klebsiella pneumoniae]
MTISLRKVQKWIFYFLVFFIVFDGVRSNLVISGFISPFRELFLNLFILCSIPLLKLCKRKDVALVAPYLIISALAIINIPITLSIDITTYNVGPINVFENKYSAVYKHIIFSIIFLSMICFIRNDEESATKGIGLMINLAAIYSIITIPIYLYGAPLFKENFRDWGRMGVGYPTMDGQMICFSIFCLIFLVKQKSVFLFNIKMAALLIGLVAQNTGTAIVTMVVIGALSIIKKPGKTFTYVAIMIPFIAALVIKQYYSNPEFFTDMLYVLNTKIEQLLHPEMASSSNLDTLQMRAAQFDMLEKVLKHDPMLRIFGVGGEAYIENEFRLTLVAYGIFSFAAFIISFVWMAFISINKKNNNKLLLLTIIVMWAFTSYTLSSIHLFTTSFMFCLVFSYTYITGERDRMVN